MTLYPHNHQMWAVIGIYGGREDNAFFRRSAEGLMRQNERTLELKDVIPLGESVIHAVTNPLAKITGGIHVYGGDFFGAPRSEWDPETLQERPFDVEHLREVFAEANERLKPDP
jgi:predicted metal-dependent enzyme (double-stranded beta helix superfamily)